MIIFHGISSDTLGLIVESYPARPIPKRKEQKWSVPGRNGDIIAVDGSYENVVRTYDCYISAEAVAGGLQSAANRIANWLTYGGYGTLRDDYDANCFVYAHFSGPVDIENTINRFGRFQLKFDCKPQRYTDDGKTQIEVANWSTITNPENMTALPLIELTGSGSGSVAVGDYTLNLSGDGFDVDGVVIDCENQEVYRGTENLNKYASGKFPKLIPGLNLVRYSASITGCTITPNWWRL